MEILNKYIDNPIRDKQLKPSEVASPNSRPKEVDVTKKPDIEASRPAEVQSDQD